MGSKATVIVSVLAILYLCVAQSQDNSGEYDNIRFANASPVFSI